MRQWLCFLFLRHEFVAYLPSEGIEGPSFNRVRLLGYLIVPSSVDLDRHEEFSCELVV